MGKAIKLSEDMVGKKVRCINKADCFHPKVGTVGVIVEFDKVDNNTMAYFISWPKGTTTGNDEWWAYNNCIELVEDKQEIPDMTNEEIWEMLEPKMEKNGLTYLHYGYDGDGKKFFYYKDSDVINAIAVAYRSGYERCMKGRPFKFRENKVKKEKKQSGHWEPVDPENLPKEGTKVRYVESRGHVFGLYDGDTGTVVSGLGFNVNMNRINLVIHTSKIIGKYFDMWVEDDE